MKKALDRHLHLFHPLRYERADIDGPLAVQWGSLKPTSDSVLEFVYCNCKKSKCTTNQCCCAAVMVVLIVRTTTFRNELTLMRSSKGEFFDDDEIDNT